MAKQRVTYCAVLALGILASVIDADSVGAQSFYIRTPFSRAPYYGPPRLATDGLPLRQIMRSVRLAGYIPVGVPVRRGSNYVVIADAPGRGPVRVAVNAYAGDIVSVTSVRPDGAPVVAQDLPPPRPSVGVRAPEDRIATHGGSEQQNVNRPNSSATLRPPREVATGGLTNVPAANARATGVPTTESNSNVAARVPMPRPRPGGPPPRDAAAAGAAAGGAAAGSALMTQGPAPGDARGVTPMVLPLPAQPSGPGNSGSVKPETPKSATPKSGTTLVPVAPLD
jgi:hypothetical protein